MDAGATYTIARETLASLLERSSDPLAPSARAGLSAPEAAESLTAWTSSREDLLATYSTRLARADAGEGPVTQRLREYTEVLRDQTTPKNVDEVGWAAGDTFYVALLGEDGVLAVSTVARAVWHLGQSTMQLGQGTSEWVDVKTFGIGEGFDDVTLIKNLLHQPAYAEDHRGSSSGGEQGNTHGLDRRDVVDPKAFSAVSADEARRSFRAWVDATGSQDAGSRADLTGNVDALLKSADSIYRLPAPGFDEVVAVNRTDHRLSVIMARRG